MRVQSSTNVRERESGCTLQTQSRTVVSAPHTPTICRTRGRCPSIHAAWSGESPLRLCKAFTLAEISAYHKYRRRQSNYRTPIFLSYSLWVCVSVPFPPFIPGLPCNSSFSIAREEGVPFSIVSCKAKLTDRPRILIVFFVASTFSARTEARNEEAQR